MWQHVGGMGWWMIVWWIVGIVVLTWLVRLATGSHGGPGARSEDAPEQILKRRYASGEIDREEYQRRLEDLRR